MSSSNGIDAGSSKDLVALSAQLHEGLSSFNANDEPARLKLFALSQQITATLETPSERLGRTCWLEPFVYTAIRVLIDLDVFATLSKTKTPMTVASLAEKAGADPVLLSRLLKHIATQAFVAETGVDEYRANDFTELMATPEAKGVSVEMFEFTLIQYHLPAFLKEIKYANPTDKDNSLFQYGAKTKLHYFDFISQPGQEHRLEAFQGHMRFKTFGGAWFETKELMTHLFGSEGDEVAKKGGEAVAMVDVGGNTGLDLLKFHAARAEVKGRLVLQDLTANIESLDQAALKEKGVEPQAHDFFTPQPVQGARMYYLKMILHDWPDVQGKEILKNLRSAMEPGWSRILLNEIVVPDIGANWFETSVDMIMLSAHSAQERRQGEWRKLVESVEGLKVVKIWNIDGAVERIVEIEAF